MAQVTERHQRLSDAYNAHYSSAVPTIREFVILPRYCDLGETEEHPAFVADSVLAVLEKLFDSDLDYHHAALCCGIGWGKSFLVSIANAYIAYCVLCLKDPQTYYGLAPGTTIAICNFSTSATNAKDIVFHNTQARIDLAPCFQDPGFQRDKKISSELKWPHKYVSIYPGNSSSRSALGYNLIAAVLDEAAFMDEVEGSIRSRDRSANARYDAAEELYHATAKRITSRGNWRWQRDARLMMISSPCYVDDFLQRQVNAAQTNPKIFALRLPTWEGAQKANLCGATFTDEVCGEVPIEYRDDFTANPERARRDLGAIPSEAIEPFFGDPQKVQAAYSAGTAAGLVNCFDGIEVRAGWHADSGEQRFAHIDLGIKRDTAGIAVGHWDRECGVVYDGLTFLDRTDFAGGEVDLEHVRELLVELTTRGVRFGLVTYDGYQSADSIQLLKKAGIPADLLSVDRDMAAYDTLREFIYTGRALLPSQGRAIRFGEEARRLELVKGKKVDHPPRGSKDVADAAAGVAMQVGIKWRGVGLKPGSEVGAGAATTRAVNQDTGEEEDISVSKWQDTTPGVVGVNVAPTAGVNDAQRAILEQFYPALKKRKPQG